MAKGRRIHIIISFMEEEEAAATGAATLAS